MSIYNITDAPWIKNADNNGLLPCAVGIHIHHYRVETVEANSNATIETFEDLIQAKDFYKQCLANNVISAEIWGINSNGDKVELIELYEREKE